MRLVVHTCDITGTLNRGIRLTNKELHFQYKKDQIVLFGVKVEHRS